MSVALSVADEEPMCLIELRMMRGSVGMRSDPRGEGPGNGCDDGDGGCWLSMSGHL